MVPSEPEQGLAAEVIFEVIMRKQLRSNPGGAARIIQEIKAKHWPADAERRLPRRKAKVSSEFLLLWSRLDLAGMQRWVDSQLKNSEETWSAKCI